LQLGLGSVVSVCGIVVELKQLFGLPVMLFLLRLHFQQLLHEVARDSFPDDVVHLLMFCYIHKFTQSIILTLNQPYIHSSHDRHTIPSYPHLISSYPHLISS